MKNKIILGYNIAMIAVFLFYVTFSWFNWPTDFILGINPVLIQLGWILPLISLILFGYQAFTTRSVMWYIATLNMACLSICMLSVNYLLTNSFVLMSVAQMNSYMMVLFSVYIGLMSIGIICKKKILGITK